MNALSGPTLCLMRECYARMLGESARSAEPLIPAGALRKLCSLLIAASREGRPAPRTRTGAEQPAQCAARAARTCWLTMGRRS
jgi:hypothetical protein